VISRISSCTAKGFLLSQPKATCVSVKRAMCHIRIVWLCWAVLSCVLVQTPAARAQSIEEAFSGSLTEMPSGKLSVSGAFYVPVYSSVAMSNGKLRADFAVTLSIHNASETRPLVLRRIAYFDTGGKMVQNYLKGPVALKPFATIEVFVPTTDVRGGTGANFVVDWAASGQIAEPVVEALMFGDLGSAHYGFVSQARPIKVVPEN
jgi:hypothetical protein